MDVVDPVDTLGRLTQDLVRRRVRWVGAMSMLLGLGVLSLGGWVWRRAVALDQELDPGRAEEHRLGEALDARVNRLRTYFLRYLVIRDEATWVRFTEARDAFEAWQGPMRSGFGTVGERALLERLDGVLRRYLAAAERVRGSAVAEAGRGHPGNAVEEVLRVGADLGAVAAELRGHHEDLVEERIRSLEHQLRSGVRDLTVLVLILMGTVAALIVGLWRDLVEPLGRRFLEAQARIAHQETLAALGTLAAGVAHEIRNPLAALKARLFLLRRRLEPGHPGVDDARVLDAEIDRLAGVVREVLESVRPEPARPVACPVDALLAETRNLLEPEAAAKGIRLDSAAGDTGLTARVDPDQIRRVLVNLVRNAMEACGPGGRVGLTTGREGEGRSEEWVWIEVADSGPGVPEGHRDRIFEPYFTTHPGGTGLGLSLARDLVRRNGGHLDLQGGAGPGAVFRIRLPTGGGARADSLP